MARPHTEVIRILRQTVSALEASNHYQWGHIGACNCGFLAQQATRLSKAEIHRRALQRYGDWTEQLSDYCPTNGLLIDDVIAELLGAGFTQENLKNLERLSDPVVLSRLPCKSRSYLQYNRKEDVLLYLTTWVEYLESQLPEPYKKEAHKSIQRNFSAKSEVCV